MACGLTTARRKDHPMTNTSILKMPDGFLWGVATAAHQNEGGNRNNQWTAWEAQPGRIHNGAKAGRAADWWNLETAAADFDRAAELGINSLRLSVEWSRIEPEPGLFDQTSLRKYAEMIGLLRARGIEPMVTLHHFTDPLWLTGMGVWENPKVVDFFARFTSRVVEALGDQVTLWCTVNEPIVYAYSGYLGSAAFPPGVNSVRRAFNVLRRMLLAHGRAYRTIHRLQTGARVGLAHHVRVFLPANPARAADRRAAALLDRVANRNVYEAITGGKLLPPLGTGGRVTQMIDTCDYMGVNYYSPTRVRVRPDPTWRALHAAILQPGRGAERHHAHRRGVRRDRAARPLPGVDAGRRVRQTDLHHRERRARRRRRRAAALPRHAPGRDRRAPSWTARTCAAFITGRWWTTSSGRLRGACASACSNSTRRRESAPRAPAPRSTAGWRAPNGVPVSLLEKVAPGYRW